MRKNVASQVICAQLNSATDGSPVTSGTTTVYVLGDGGTQASGGAATHEGNGCWSFAPSQANTNYNHVAFTFVNSAAIAQTVQTYPVAYDPYDSVRLGLTALPNAAAEAAGGLYTRGTGAGQINQPANGRVDTNTVAMSANVITAAATASDYLAEINAECDAALADAGVTTTVTGRIDAAITTRASQTSVDTLAGYVDTEVAAIKAKTDSLTFTVSGQVDANIKSVIGDAVQENGSTTTNWGGTP